MRSGDRHDRFMAALYRAHAEWAAKETDMPRYIETWYGFKASTFSGSTQRERSDNVVREYDLGMRLGQYQAGERLWESRSDSGVSASSATSQTSDTGVGSDGDTGPVLYAENTSQAPRKSYPRVVIDMFALYDEENPSGR